MWFIGVEVDKRRVHPLLKKSWIRPCTVVVRRNPRALNDSPDKNDLSYYFFYFVNNYLCDKLSSK